MNMTSTQSNRREFLGSASAALAAAFAGLSLTSFTGCEAPRAEQLYPERRLGEISRDLRFPAPAPDLRSFTLTGTLKSLGQEVVQTPPISPTASIDPMQDVKESIGHYRPFGNPNEKTLWVSEFKDNRDGTTIQVLSSRQLPEGEVSIRGHMAHVERQAQDVYLHVNWCRRADAAPGGVGERGNSFHLG